MNENEIWRNIEGYEGLYQVSSLGRVKSLGNDKSRKDKILFQYESKSGYLYVTLCKEGKLKSFRVHRLVANAFIPNPNNFKCVNHKDECKTNNCVDNLEWCDHKYNTNYGTCIQRRAEKQRNGVLSKQVYQYDKNHNLIKIWQSVMECGRQGFDQGNISKCCLGKRKSHRGYIWSYTPL